MRALESAMTHPSLPGGGGGGGSAKLGQDTIYLCNFRVSVDGEWLCLKELHDLDGQDSSAGATIKGRLADADGAPRPRLMQSGANSGLNSYRNSWNGSEGICGVGGKGGQRLYDDLLVGRPVAVKNKRFSDCNWANLYCRCLSGFISTHRP